MEKAGENNLTSVALPALGTRYNHNSVQVSAAGMLKGIDHFSKSHPLSSVRRVVIVLCDGHRREEISKVYEVHVLSIAGIKDCKDSVKLIPLFHYYS